MTDFELSRRKLLGSLGVVGAASASAGYGTTAFLSDQETFENDAFVSGTLDLKLGWEEHYVDQIPDSVDAVDPDVKVPEGYVGMPDPSSPVVYVAPDDVSALLDAKTKTKFPEGGVGDEPCLTLGDTPDDLQGGPLFDLQDVKPGDFGETTFTLALCDNPGYVWLTGELQSESENRVIEPERLADRQGVVELIDEIRTVLWYDESCDNVLDSAGGESVIFRGSLREFLTRVESGILLDGKPGVGGIDCFAPETANCLGFAWWLPDNVGNDVQTDSVTFDLGFYSEQCRHNPIGTNGPAISFVAFCVPDGSRPSDFSTDDLTLEYEASNGAPTSLQWETNGTEISTVVVKSGRCDVRGWDLSPERQGMTNFQYPDGTASGDVVSCMGEIIDVDEQCPASPAPAGEDTLVKLEYSDSTFVRSTTNDTCPDRPGGPSGGGGKSGGR